MQNNVQLTFYVPLQHSQLENKLIPGKAICVGAKGGFEHRSGQQRQGYSDHVVAVMQEVMDAIEGHVRGGDGGHDHACSHGCGCSCRRNWSVLDC
jgi:hypothetical protein